MDHFEARIPRITEDVDHNREMGEINAIAIARGDPGSRSDLAPWNLTKQRNRQSQADAERRDVQRKVGLGSRHPS